MQTCFYLGKICKMDLRMFNNNNNNNGYNLNAYRNHNKSKVSFKNNLMNTNNQKV